MAAALTALDAALRLLHVSMSMEEVSDEEASSPGWLRDGHADTLLVLEELAASSTVLHLGGIGGTVARSCVPMLAPLALLGWNLAFWVYAFVDLL